MLEILRYFWRRKVRTALTVLAVTVGIFAVTAVGGIAEQLNRSIMAFEQDPLQRISVWPRDYNQPLGESAIRQIRRLESVAGISRVLSGELQLPEETAVRIMVNPESFTGIQSDILGLEYEPPAHGLKLWQGRLPAPASRVETVVTWSLADSMGLEVGDTLMIRDRPFTVVGIWEKSPTAEGRTASINYETAESLLSDFEALYAGVSVIPKPGADPEKLVTQIEEVAPEAQAYSPAEMAAQSRQQVIIFSAVVGASGVISLLIGAFTIINTMVVSVQERRREIGLKKALGAEDRHILAEVVTEAVLIAIIGGVMGVGGGALLGHIANQLLTTSLGMQLYQLTPRLAVGVVVFSVVMGVVAGIYPAWRAARLDPVVALRDGGNVPYAGRGLKRWLYLIRRNARNLFTVGGIAIGVFALVLLGSLTEALGTYARNVTEATDNLLMVVPSNAAAPLNRGTARQLRQLPGVVDVILTNQGQFPVNFSDVEGEKEIQVQFWASESRTGDMGMAMPVRNTIAVGRFVAPESKDEVVLGAGRAASAGAAVGDELLIDGHPFHVVGIWNRIPFDVGGHDMAGFVSVEALAWLSGAPDAVAGVAVRAESVVTAQALTEIIKTEWSGLDVITVTEILGSIKQVFMGLIAAMAGIFSIAVFVGSISVVNTMVIAVNEQTPQIGLKKAVGAENGDILAEVLLDAAKLGTVGGVLGAGMAWAATAILNPLVQTQLGLNILHLSPRLAVGAIIFSLVLGMVSGLFPANRAAKLDPVLALHAE